VFAWEAYGSIKQFSEPLLSAVVAVVSAVIMIVRGMPMSRRIACCRSRADGHFPAAAQGTFDDLVKFTTVQPDAAAFGALVNLHTLAFGHDEVGVGTYRAYHSN
jgi:hypothetical protein